MSKGVSRRNFLRTMRNGFYASLPFVAGMPARAVFEQAHGDAWMQQAHQIGVALFSCASDNAFVYPDGKSSTEIFQKLIDGNYVNDPGVFYLPLSGKTKGLGGQKLKPENVGFDLTGGLDANVPDQLPMVFTTGYKVTYAASGGAVPLIKPPPPGMAVMYKNNSSKFLRAAPDGTVANVLAADFDAGGKVYLQLTPEGTSP